MYSLCNHLKGVIRVHAQPTSFASGGGSKDGDEGVVPRPADYVRMRRRRILADMSARLLAGDDPDELVLPALFEALAAERIIDASLGFIVTEVEQGMKLAFSKGFAQKMIERCVRLDFGQAACGMVAATWQPLHLTDIQRSLDPIAELVRSAGITAYACEPLVVGDRLLGTLSFASRTRRSFDSDDILFFRAIARKVAIARERARSQVEQTSEFQAKA